MLDSHWLPTVLLGLFVAAAVHASPAGLKNPDFLEGTTGWTLTLNDASTSQVVPEVDGRQGVLAVEARPADGAKAWSIRLQQAIPGGIEEGMPVSLRVVARSPDGTPIRPFLEQAADPYAKLAGDTASLTPQFEAYVFQGKAESSFGPGEWRVTLQLAVGSGRIEIDSITVVVGEAAASAPPPNAAPAAPARAAQRERAVTREGQPVMPADVLSAFRLSGSQRADGRLEVVPVDGAGFEKAVRLTTTALPANSYAIQVAAANEAAIRRDDVLHLTFYARTRETDDETGEGQTHAVFEVIGPPHTKTIEFPTRFQHDWTKVQVAGKAKADYAPGEAQLAFRMGYNPQVIEIGGIELLNYGDTRTLESLPVTRLNYPGREAQAAWRAAADERIRTHRMGDIKLSVLDAAGRPVSGAQVQVAMRRHAFRFGSVMNANWVHTTQDATNKAIYLDKFAELFNAVTFEASTKWPEWRRPERRAAALAVIPWLEERDFYIRGHTIIWPSWRRTPEYLRTMENDPTALGQEVYRHIDDIVPALADHVDAWDVVNEPFTDYDVLDIVGKGSMVGWFKAVHRLDPTADLYLNEASAPNTPPNHPVYDSLEGHLRMLLDAGAPLHGVGLQGHFGWSLRSPDELLEVLDRFARLGLKIEITEFDVNVTDEALQADYLRDAMTVFFSHPAVVSFVQWGFWEGRHWRPDAALYRRDWSIKPSGQAYRDLVFDRWWTDEIVVTDQEGRAALRGFLGDYVATVTWDGKTAASAFSLSSDGRSLTITLPE